MAKQHVTTTVNNDEFEFLCEPKASMLDVLRDELAKRKDCKKKENNPILARYRLLSAPF